MTLFALQCPRIQGLLVLVVLLLLLLLLLALPAVVVLPPLLLPTPASWRCSEVSLPHAVALISIWMWWISTFRLCSATRRLFTDSGMSRSRNSPTSLSSQPSLTPTARWLLPSWLLSALTLLSCFFGRRRWGAGRRQWEDEGRGVAGFTSALHSSFFPFWCLDDKGEKRVISISVFHSSVVCNMDKNLLNAWLVIFKWLVKFIMLIWYLSMICMIILVYLFM
jgi:hypothetical protein